MNPSGVINKEKAKKKGTEVLALKKGKAKMKRSINKAKMSIKSLSSKNSTQQSSIQRRAAFPFLSKKESLAAKNASQLSRKEFIARKRGAFPAIAKNEFQSFGNKSSSFIGEEPFMRNLPKFGKNPTNSSYRNTVNNSWRNFDDNVSWDESFKKPGYIAKPPSLPLPLPSVRNSAGNTCSNAGPPRMTFGGSQLSFKTPFPPFGFKSDVPSRSIRSKAPQRIINSGPSLPTFKQPTIRPSGQINTQITRFNADVPMFSYDSQPESWPTRKMERPNDWRDPMMERSYMRQQQRILDPLMRDSWIESDPFKKQTIRTNPEQFQRRSGPLLQESWTESRDSQRFLSPGNSFKTSKLQRISDSTESWTQPSVVTHEPIRSRRVFEPSATRNTNFGDHPVNIFRDHRDESTHPDNAMSIGRDNVRQLNSSLRDDVEPRKVGLARNNVATSYNSQRVDSFTNLTKKKPTSTVDELRSMIDATSSTSIESQVTSGNDSYSNSTIPPLMSKKFKNAPNQSGFAAQGNRAKQSYSYEDKCDETSYDNKDLPRLDKRRTVGNLPLDDETQVANRNTIRDNHQKLSASENQESNSKNQDLEAIIKSAVDAAVKKALKEDYERREATQIGFTNAKITAENRGGDFIEGKAPWRSNSVIPQTNLDAVEDRFGILTDLERGIDRKNTSSLTRRELAYSLNDNHFRSDRFIDNTGAPIQTNLGACNYFENESIVSASDISNYSSRNQDYASNSQIHEYETRNYESGARNFPTETSHFSSINPNYYSATPNYSSDDRNPHPIPAFSDDNRNKDSINSAAAQREDVTLVTHYVDNFFSDKRRKTNETQNAKSEKQYGGQRESQKPKYH